MWNRQQVTEKLHPVADCKMLQLRQQWFEQKQKEVNYKQFVPMANEWFQSTKINNIHGWDKFPLIDVTMGNTHYIESLILKFGWDGFQILRNEYAYYTLMGKHGVEADALEPNKPLLITLPHWQYCDLRPEWSQVLAIAEQRNIDIHLDLAWIITAKDLEIDLSHPAIKSFGMSMSKYNLQWSRVGLRWSRQKSMDSVTIFNDYYHDTNITMTSIGAFYIDNIERDYAWNNYSQHHIDVCASLDLLPTKIIHVALDPQNQRPCGIGKILSQCTPQTSSQMTNLPAS